MCKIYPFISVGFLLCFHPLRLRYLWLVSILSHISSFLYSFSVCRRLFSSHLLSTYPNKTILQLIYFIASNQFGICVGAYGKCLCNFAPFDALLLIHKPKGCLRKKEEQIYISKNMSIHHFGKHQTKQILLFLVLALHSCVEFWLSFGVAYN